MNWTDEQRNIIDSRDQDVLVAAAAGSGKTAVLVERIIQKITDEKRPVSIDELLVVTFTKAAAAQMKDKIRKALERKLEEHPDSQNLARQLALVHKAQISTIDSFCMSIVKEQFHVLGIDPNIRVAQEAELKLMQEEVLQKVIEKAYETQLSGFTDLIDSFTSDKSDSKVEELIKRVAGVALSYPRPYDWLQGAREALLVENSEMLWEQKWFQAYLAELKICMQEAMDGIMQAKEFAYGSCISDKLRIVWEDEFTIADTFLHATNLKQLVDACNMKAKNYQKKTIDGADEAARTFHAIREGYKKTMKEALVWKEKKGESVIEQMLEDFQVMRRPLGALLEVVTQYMEAFAHEKRRKNLMDFNDVEHMALQALLERYDENGIPVPNQGAKEISEMYDEILIDEYQDSNFLQEEILWCVSKQWKGEHNLFMVGDVKQSIYRFRMARPDLFLSKYNRFGRETSGPEYCIELRRNFRSRSQVLDTVNAICYQIMRRELGGIRYTPEVALVNGAKFAPKEESITTCSTELLLVNRNTEDANDTNEEEPDSLMSDEVSLSDVEAEAEVIAKRIRSLVSKETGMQVWDEELGCYRLAEYRDIVILYRSANVVGKICASILRNHNIPVFTESSSGYFHSIEVENLLSLLTVVDNSYVEIAMAAYLLSPMAALTNEELAELTLWNKKCHKGKDKKCSNKSLYDLAKDWLAAEAKRAQERLYQKLSRAIELLDAMKKQKEYRSIAELIWYALKETGYFQYVGAMAEGEKRQANILMLIAKAQEYEEGSYKGLFYFLRYVERLRVNNVDFGEANLIGEHENLVRIMSMHKSKGLEFPIVFVSGLGRKFNQQDSKQSVTIHADYFVASNYVQLQQRYKKNTEMKRAINRLDWLETLAEEERILYVAMTRAKEKLILTASVKDLLGEVAKQIPLATYTEEVLPYTVIKSANSYLHWIIQAFIRHPAFQKTVSKLPSRVTGKGETISASYDIVKPYAEELPLIVELFTLQDLVQEQVAVMQEQDCGLAYITYLQNQKPAEEDVERFQSRFDWRYPYQEATVSKGKVTVTELKRRYAPEEEVLEQQRGTGQMKKGAKYGTEVHALMQRLDYTKQYDIGSLKAFGKELTERRILHKELVDTMPYKEIISFTESVLGKRLREAAVQNHVFCEKQFVAGFPQCDLMPDTKSTELILLQGVIDVYFEEEDGMVLLDYKTDYVAQGDRDTLLTRYRTQILSYKKVLEQLTGKTVKESYIYSFSLGEAILVL